MKKIVVSMFVLILWISTAGAQVPTQLPFLTNRAELASWALQQVSQINVGIYPSTPVPEGKGDGWGEKGGGSSGGGLGKSY
jgi:hypothetical protein